MFKTKLIVSVPLFDDGMRELHQELVYNDIVVPIGFKTDYASIPKIFWNILPPTGSYTYAAVIHDWLYASGLYTKEEADRLFYKIMIELGVSKVKAVLMYNAVKYFGDDAWNEHKRSRDNKIFDSLENGIGA